MYFFTHHWQVSQKPKLLFTAHYCEQKPPENTYKSLKLLNYQGDVQTITLEN